MFEKEKEKNKYSIIIAIGGLFTFVILIFTYFIVDLKIKNLNVTNNDSSKIENLNVTSNDSSKIDKILNLQYAQIGGEVNYDTVLKISDLSKDKTKKQMDDYLKQLEGGKVAEQPSQPQAPSATPKGSISMVDLQSIKDSSYIDGNIDADITWLEYSDLECPFCAKLHNSGTVEAVKAKYGDRINIVFNHFPLDFHPNALPGAQILECIGELGGSEQFYTVMRASYKSTNSSRAFLIDKAVELGIDKALLETCSDSGKYIDKVKGQMTIGSQKFSISGTPGNVLINNKTGEFIVLSGALPYSSFESTIDSLLK